jgi:hypothetical protein
MVDVIVGTHLAPTMVYNPFIMHLTQNVHLRTFAMVDIPTGMHLALARVDILGKYNWPQLWFTLLLELTWPWL